MFEGTQQRRVSSPVSSVIWFRITELLRSADGADLMRQILGFMLQALVDAEVNTVFGGGPNDPAERHARLLPPREGA